MVETLDDPYYLFDNHYMVAGDWLEFRQWAEPPSGLHLHRDFGKLHKRTGLYGKKEKICVSGTTFIANKLFKTYILMAIEHIKLMSKTFKF